MPDAKASIGTGDSPGCQCFRESGPIDARALIGGASDTDTPAACRLGELRRELRRLEQVVAESQARARQEARRKVALGVANRRLRRALVEARHAADHDTLTGLPNRRLFQDRLTQAMAQADRAGKQVAVLLLDLDGFKSINDTLGHLAGDNLLRQVARYLGECTRDMDTVCRYGGDEFIVMLTNLTGDGATTRVMEKINAVFATPYRIETHSVAVGVSMGVAVYPRDANSDRELVRQADLAMYLAKERRPRAVRHAATSTPLNAAAEGLSHSGSTDQFRLVIPAHPMVTNKSALP